MIRTFPEASRKCLKWSVLKGYLGDLTYSSNIFPDSGWHLLAEGLHGAGIRLCLLLLNTTHVWPEPRLTMTQSDAPLKKQESGLGGGICDESRPTEEKRVK